MSFRDIYGIKYTEFVIKGIGKGSKNQNIIPHFGLRELGEPWFKFLI